MSRSDEMAERHGRVLTELSELGLALARGLKARAEAASTLKEAEGLALAFHRIARTVRLTLALESRLARERVEIVRSEQAQVRLRAADRQKQVRAAIARDVWSETEGEEAEALLDELDERLETDVLFEEFVQGPVEACIARIRAELGLPANDAGPRVAASAVASAPSGADWRSSA